jgi:hypothetical protein
MWLPVIMGEYTEVNWVIVWDLLNNGECSLRVFYGKGMQELICEMKGNTSICLDCSTRGDPHGVTGTGC